MGIHGLCLVYARTALQGGQELLGAGVHLALACGDLGVGFPLAHLPFRVPEPFLIRIARLAASQQNAFAGHLEDDRITLLELGRPSDLVGDRELAPRAEPGHGHESKGTQYMAQHSLRQGKRIARNVAAAQGKVRKHPFRYRTLAVLIDTTTSVELLIKT